VDLGALLEKDDPEYDAYASVYDKKHGYYDSGQYYVETKERAIKDVKDHLSENADNLYGIVSLSFVPEDADPDDTPVEDETYLVDDVVYSACKCGGEIHENFIAGQKV